MDGARASARTGVNGEACGKKGLFVHVCTCACVAVHKSVDIFKGLFKRVHKL